MREQHIEHTVREGADLNTEASICIRHDHRGSEAVRILPKKFGRRVSERRASTARQYRIVKRKNSLRSLQFAKKFQHE